MMYDHLGDKKYISLSFIIFGTLFLVLSLVLHIDYLESYYLTHLYSVLNFQEPQSIRLILLLCGGLLLLVGIIESFVMRFVFKKVPKYSYDERYRKEVMHSEAKSSHYHTRASVILLLFL